MTAFERLHYAGKAFVRAVARSMFGQRKPRGEWDGPTPTWTILMRPELARPIEGTPFVKASYRDLFDHYLTSPGFVTGDRYPASVKRLKNEIGYWAIFDGLKIYPVARVIVTEPYECRSPEEARAAIKEIVQIHPELGAYADKFLAQ